jgi:hypothetical protein
MTRGHDSLAFGLEVGVGALKATAVMAARPINLKVLRADSDELARHDEHIIAIGRACGGEALWTSMYPKDGTSE